MRRLFPGYHKPLPEKTRLLVIANGEPMGISEPGRALFYHCFELVKHDQATRERLSSFLNLYGFARNVSLSLLLGAILLGVGIATDGLRTDGVGEHAGLAAMVALGASVGMFYRYLKFFREYTVEVFRGCAGKRGQGGKL